MKKFVEVKRAEDKSVYLMVIIATMLVLVIGMFAKCDALMHRIESLESKASGTIEQNVYVSCQGSGTNLACACAGKNKDGDTIYIVYDEDTNEYVDSFIIEDLAKR